jgi:hypothetical protein
MLAKLRESDRQVSVHTTRTRNAIQIVLYGALLLHNESEGTDVQLKDEPQRSFSSADVRKSDKKIKPGSSGSPSPVAFPARDPLCRRTSS